MPRQLSQNRSKPDKDTQLANIALLYYGEGLTQGEIAKRLKVSRATIVNMLRESRDRGIVEIRVDGKHLVGSNLARDLRLAYDLTDVYIAQPGDAAAVSSDRALALAQLGRVGAAALLDMIEPGDRVGIAWGETLTALSNVMPKAETSRVEICQLIGSMHSARLSASENCTIQIARKLDAACHTLHAPGMVASADLAEIFRNEPTIKSQLERLTALDMSVVSVGNMDDDTHLAAAGMASPAELAAARAQGAVGILCCRYIDADGRACPLPPDDRLIAADLTSLRAARKRLLVVCGLDRLDATRAALRGGFVTHLCIDQALGAALLNA